MRNSSAIAACAVVAVLAGAGGATAAAMVTSKNIKDGTIQMRDLSPTAKQRLTGVKLQAVRVGLDVPANKYWRTDMSCNGKNWMPVGFGSWVNEGSSDAPAYQDTMKDVHISAGVQFEGRSGPWANSAGVVQVWSPRPIHVNLEMYCMPVAHLEDISMEGNN